MPLTTLFLDLNSYFASVEQQVQPRLRGKPIAVAPINNDAGCCIAASVEAKKHGVKTGTRVDEARRLCPTIEIVDARPRLYVMMHHRVIEAVETCIPVAQAHSIDEVSCRLDRTQRTPEAAERLAKRIKDAIRTRCGVVMRCSIGIAPNRPLAKLGTDMRKPDGLVILREEDFLPDGGVIAHLPASELAGIGPRMDKRLERAGVRTIGDLYGLSIRQMRTLWGGLVGERWHMWLRGQEVIEPRTRKSTIGHSHVLAPELRSPDGARGVAFRLLLKAAARMRHDNYAAKRLTLMVAFTGGPALGPFGVGLLEENGWRATASLGGGCTNSGTMLETLGELWEGLMPLLRVRVPLQVSVSLTDLVNAQSQTLPLFEQERTREGISRAMDAVNQKFGANVVYAGSAHGAKDHGRGGIAFHHVPNLEIADSVQSRQRAGSERIESDEDLEGLLGVGYIKNVV